MARSRARSLAIIAVSMAAAAAPSMATSRAFADEPVRPAAQTPPIDPTTPEPGTLPAAAAAVEAAPPAGSAVAPAPPPAGDVVEPPVRRTGLEPKPVLPPPPRATLDVDPIADGAVIAVSLGFAGILDLINGTGEVRPQQISPTFERSQLLGIDRGAISQDVDKRASTFSNIGLFTFGVFAVVDPILTGFREKSAQSALVDAVMYAESVSLTFAMTNIVKVAVRRPRPQAYIDAEAHRGDPSYSNADTDSALSFFSGHASTTAAIGATATYLAFMRSPKTARPWVTLIVAAGLSTFVSIERVRAGAHFPTDVIAGMIAGAGVGLVVPHLHRSEDIKQRRVWVGFQPAPVGNGGTAMLSGIF